MQKSYLINVLSAKVSGVFGCLLLVIALSFSTTELKASHIVGGELTYKCLGNNQFELQLTFFRDCEHALPDAFFDNPAVIWVYDELGNPLSPGFRRILLENPEIVQVVEPVPSGCVPEELQDEVCVERAIYRKNVTLADRRGGYIFAYQRCCRNETLTNITDPTNTGTTLTVRISQDALESCNSAPDLGDFPPLYICRGEDFALTQTGIDVDGDSIVYRLCAPFLGATFDDPRPAGNQEVPDYPFDSITWEGDNLYSTMDMLGNPDDPLTIDPQTGIISGTPLINGQFQVGICIEEYRDGILIGTTQREFQLNVRSCIGDPIADFEMPDIVCDTLDVQLINTSIFADTYQWFVDLGNGPEFFSNEESPIYTFPDTGLYEIILVASQDTSCFDTLAREISLQISGLVPDFEVAFEDCRDTVVLAPVDLSIDTIGEIVQWYWEVNNGDTVFTSTEQAPKWVFDEQFVFDLKLVVTSSNGCIDSLEKFDISFNLIDFEFIGDTVDICPFERIQIVASSDSTLSYTWDPIAGLHPPDSHNPTVITDTSILYTVTVTDGICTVVDSILVNVLPVSDIVLTDLADSCDLERIVIAENLVEGSGNWYHDNEYTDLIASGDTLRIEVPFEKRVYFTGLDTISNCLIQDSIDLVSFMVNLEFDDNIDLCQGESLDIELDNIDSNDTLVVVQWDPNPIIISDLDSLVITIQSDSIFTTWLHFEVENQFGCSLRDSIMVTYHEQEEVSFDADYKCGESEVQFTYTSDWVGSVIWDFGDGNSSTELNPLHEYEEEGVYIVSLTSTGRCFDTDTMELTINFFDIDIQDTIIACFADSVTLNPGGDPSLSYEWSPESLFSNPNEASPTVQVDNDTTITVVIFDPEADDTCILYDTIQIVVPPLFTISSIPDTLALCELKEHNLEVVIDTEDANVSIQWFDEDGNLIGEDTIITVFPGDHDFYEVVVTDEFGCELRVTIPVVFDLLEFGFGFLDNEVACINDTTAIIITGLDPDQEYMFEWQDHPSIIEGLRSDTLVIYAEETVTYVVAVTNEDGCTKIDSFTVEPRDLTLLIDAIADPSTIQPGENSMLDVLGASDDWIFMWTDTSAELTLSALDIRNPIASPIKPTTYWVTVIDEFGCVGMDSVTINTTELPCEFPYVYLPNAFSPNGDGINDVLYVRGIDIDEMELIIYNRLGQQVFRSRDIRNGWDGTFNGEEMPPDVYAYHLWVLCIGGDEDVQKGNVSLIR